MDPSDLYESDYLLWTEQQAAALRHLPAGSNHLDSANLAEAIESLGRSELRSVESYLRQMLIHLLKLATDSQALAERHWREEVVTFQTEAQSAATRSMYQRLSVDRLWIRAFKSFMAGRPDGVAETALADAIAQRSGCPFRLEDLLEGDIDIDAAVAMMREFLRVQGLMSGR